MSVAQTSREAIKQILPTTAKANTLRIMALMRSPNINMLTRREIAEILGLENGAVAGRVNELVNRGLLVEYEDGINELTGCRAKLVCVPEVKP
jgi:DNA-binding MarR family transcriptional regulator